MSADAYDAPLVPFDDRLLSEEDDLRSLEEHEWFLDEEAPDEECGSQRGSADDPAADPPFIDRIEAAVCAWAGVEAIPHPSDAGNVAFRADGARAGVVRALAEGMAGHEALKTRLAGDPFGQALLDDALKGVGLAVLALMADVADKSEQRLIVEQLRRRSSQTERATQAKRQQGAPKRQWALQQKAAGVDWSWTTFCQQVEMQFGLSEGAGRKLLGTVRDQLDPKSVDAANCNQPQALIDRNLRVGRKS